MPGRGSSVLRPSMATLIDRFLPADARSSQEAMQRRVLAGSALLGSTVALVTVGSALAFYPDQEVVFVAGFGVGCLLLLAGTRLAAPMRLLRPFCLLLLGAFFVVQCLQTPELEWAGPKWFVLLPVVAHLLADVPDGTRASEPPLSALWGGTLLALTLIVLTAVLSARGWGSPYRADEPLVGGIEMASLIDMLLFVISVGGLLTVHRIALRQQERELRTLRSLLSVCAWCRRIRDDDGAWVEMERYLAARVERSLTHGMCPDCEHRVP